MDAERSQVVLLFGPQDTHGDPPHGLERALAVVVLVAVADLVEERARDVADVGALVSALGYRGVVAQQLLVPGAHAGRKLPDLRAGVVEIEFAVHLPPGPFEQAGDRIAQRRLPAVAQVERTRGIGGHELHHDLPSAPAGVAAVVLVRLPDLVKDPADRRFVEEEVEEPRARHFDPAHAGEALQPGLQLQRDFAG